MSKPFTMFANWVESSPGRVSDLNNRKLNARAEPYTNCFLLPDNSIYLKMAIRDVNQTPNPLWYFYSPYTKLTAC